MKTLLTLIAFVLCSFVGTAQSVQIDKVWEGTGFATTATTYLGTQSFGVGYLDSMVVVTENYDTLTAVVKMVSYTPNGIPIDTVSAISVYTTASVSVAKYSSSITPMVRRQYIRPLVTVNRSTGQTSNDTRLRVFIYKYGLKP